MNAPIDRLQLRAPWQTLLDGPMGDASAFYSAWMDCMVQGVAQKITDVFEAVLVLPDTQASGGSDPDSQTVLRPVAFWPAGLSCGGDLAALCEEALAMRMMLHRGTVPEPTLGLPASGAAVQAMLSMPLTAGDALHGVVGIKFRTVNVPQQARDWLRWGVGWLSGSEPRRDDGAVLRERLLLAMDLTLSVLGEQDARAAANAFVTEAAVRLKCDRVSLGYGDGRAVKLFALSHSADFSGKLDLARSIDAAMNEACDQGTSLCVQNGHPLSGHDSEPVPQTIWNASATSALSTREHEALARGFGTHTALSVPFFVDRRRYGVVLFEWAIDDVDDARMQVALGLPAVAGRMLLEKRHAQRAWPVRALDAFKDGVGILVGRRYPMVKLLVLVALGLAMYLAQAVGVYKVSAKAALEGGVRRVVVAPFDGYVTNAYARAGLVVSAGQLLATLDDREMRLEVERWQSQQTQFVKQMQDAQAQRNLAQIQIALAQARQASAQRRLSESQLSRTRVEAPFAGVIVSGDLTPTLGSAVKKGQTLFEIAPLDSYRVILDVEEADVRNVSVGQKGDLMVTALPGEAFPFTVRLVTPVARVSDGRNGFRVEASLDQSAERLRPGMEGIAKVTVSERNMAWIWTHRLTDWLRLQIWFWFGV